MATFIPNVTDIFPEPALFTPDFSFMDKMLQRRQSMYDQGWSQLNSVYSFVNRDLTNPQNVKERDIFLKQAKNNLKNLSGVDLSQHQNVLSAKGVFEPWANNQKALGDATLTSHWKQQESIGESYRLQDGGKYYNDFNLNYVRKQKRDFSNDAAENWEDYWKNKRSYTPYYDYQKEVQELMKEFKPSSYKIDKVNGLYKITDEDASWTQAEIRKYLESNLSDKAKQQMKIEADVTYNNDPAQMGSVYIAMAKNEMQQYDNAINLANLKIKGLTKPEDIKEAKEYVSNLEDRKKALTANVQAIEKGDYTYIKKKGEELSMNIFYNQFMNKVSNGFSHADITHKITGDDVALKIYGEDRADQRQARALAHSERMARLSGQVPGSSSGQFNTITTDEEEEVSPQSYAKQIDQVDSETSVLTSANDAMVLNWMKSLPQNQGKDLAMKDVTVSMHELYKNTGAGGQPLPPTHQYNRNLNAANVNYQKKEQLLGLARNIQNKVESTYSDEDKKKLNELTTKAAAFGQVVFSDGTTISSKELFQGVKDGTVKISSATAGTLGGLIRVPMANEDYTVTLRGKSYNVAYTSDGIIPRPRTSNISALTGVRGIYDIMQTNTFEKYQKDMNAYVKQNGKTFKVTSNLQTFPAGSWEANHLEKDLQAIFPKDLYGVQHAGIGVDGKNQGSAYFYISPKSGNEATTEQIEKSLNQRGYTNVKAIETTGTGMTLFEIKNYNNDVINQYQQFNPVERVVLQTLSSDAYANAGSYTTPPYNSRSNRRLQIHKDHNQYYLLVEGLNGTNTMDTYPGQVFTTPTQAILLGQALTATVSGVEEAQLKQLQKVLKGK